MIQALVGRHSGKLLKRLGCHFGNIVFSSGVANQPVSYYYCHYYYYYYQGKASPVPGSPETGFARAGALRAPETYASRTLRARIARSKHALRAREARRVFVSVILLVLS